ncbi:hypothetical protein WKW79_33455 [Variovorax robiniae]|uniref:Integrase n=1 Tax=Variovorax robiniae TaxID=1836199 RepID=A0ABU8XHZ7_9BURK
MVQIIRKAALPTPSEVIERLHPAVTQALAMTLREPRPAGFPLLFTADMRLIEPAVAFLHEHSVQRAHTADTLRTYAEILYDWFETLEQNAVGWADADAVDLVAYRNRMMLQPSPHTGRPYRISTINHRVRGALRFYEWAVRMHWLTDSPLVGRPRNFAVARHPQPVRADTTQASDHSLFVLRQFEPLPRPLTSAQARELLATLGPPYDLMARWQLYTGLRVSELLRLNVNDVTERRLSAASYHTIDVTRKGRKPGYVVAPASLLDETTGYLCGHRHAWLQRARRKGRPLEHKGVVHQRARHTCRQERVSARNQPSRSGLRVQSDHASDAGDLRLHAAGSPRTARQRGRLNQPTARGEGADGSRTHRDHRPVSARHRC